MSLILMLSVFPILTLCFLCYRDYYVFHISALYVAVFPLVTMMSWEGALPGAAISPAIANVVRLSAHLIFFSLLLVIALTSPRINRLPLDKSVLVIGLMAVLALAASFFANGSMGNFDQLARWLTLSLLICNLLLFHPLIVQALDQNALRYFSDYLVILCLWMGLLSLFAIVIYGNFPDWTIRLGRPLNPRVFAGFMVVALALCVFQRRSIALQLFFAAMIVGSGTRTGLIAIFLILFFRYRWLRMPLIGLGAGLAVLVIFASSAGLGANVLGVNTDLVARTDWSAGRLVGWLEALSLLPGHWVFGIGERYSLPPDLITGEELRLHNGFFESLVSYGISFAVAQLALYFLWVYRSFSRSIAVSDEGKAIVWTLQTLSVYAVLEWLFGTMYWTNLGDGFSLLLLLIFPLLFSARDRILHQDAMEITRQSEPTIAQPLNPS